MEPDLYPTDTDDDFEDDGAQTITLEQWRRLYDNDNAAA